MSFAMPNPSTPSPAHRSSKKALRWGATALIAGGLSLSLAVPAQAHPRPRAVLAASVDAPVLAIADQYVGVPYVWGGTTPAGFDCSGYTSFVYRTVGIQLPRTANAQMLATPRVSPADARPGDLVFFLSSSGRAYHNGIYAGDGYMYDSPRAGKSVSKRKIWSAAVVYHRVIS
jgi:cell wall-associated NlpC family hydrolase